ncbi:MAG TPA: sugar phosphate isomerase/epimerase [bacterium]|nr:sugar phosphate isomerase/epimerase [bacterium]
MASTNKIGICEWSLPIDGPYASKLVAELGFDGLQINIGDYHRGFSMSRKLVQDAYLEMAEKSGIEFPSMAARVTDYFTMFSSRDEEESRIVRAGIAQAIDACQAMNIPILLIPNFVKSEISGRREFEEAVEVFQWACDEAGEKEIIIAAENTLSTDDTKRFLTEIDRKNLRIYFDTQNYYLHKGYETSQMLDELIEHVCEIHVKDGKGKDLSGSLLGQGDTDFYSSMEVVKKHGYNGWIVIENYYDQKPLSDQDDDLKALIKEDLKTLKAVLW